MRLRSIAPLVFIALLAVIPVGVAYADGSLVPEMKVKEPFASVGSFGEARFKSKTEYASIDLFCMHVYFDASDPLDPGEALLFSPASQLPVINGPGMGNGGSEPQHFRSICNVPHEGDVLIPPLLDGKETLLLVAENGSFRIDRIDVEVFGTAIG